MRLLLNVLWLAGPLFAFLAWANTKLILEELADLKKFLALREGIESPAVNEVKDGKPGGTEAKLEG
ncbi:MAG TPA: hypothetical protein GXX50_02215 [Firmicutes bacterium]|uniref:hypothetical protein n=1 Tax=Gelria sp. Kuro-4 TaxID=2796927 RepID=UPI0019A144B8|nr:hypothetical protein [Gelria sp. Kuro-4]BCV25410.1 hypothetical protein kuro4_21830 [Gelria sp. Kuro-4]HHV56562.1 hypothetical protein [Bacillota bacterium]